MSTTPTLVVGVSASTADEEEERRDPDPDDEAIDVFKNGWRKGTNPEAENYGKTLIENCRGIISAIALGSYLVTLRMT